MTFDDFAALCNARRSIRFFENKPVSKEDAMHLINIARLAPNVQNVQPWHFHIVQSGSLVKKLMETSCYGNFIEGAGIFIVISCDTSMQPQGDKVLWNPRELEYSCVAAMEHLLLGATAMGLGSCFVSMHHGTSHDLLQLPHNHSVIGGVMIGHPRADQPASERERGPLKDIVTFY